MTIPTREKFEELLYDHANRVADVRRYEEQGIENEAVSAERNRRDELWFDITDAYDAQAARIAEMEARVKELLVSDDGAVDEFNAGYKAYVDGVPVEQEPPSVVYDEWRMGWAWAAFEPMRKRIAELEAILDTLLEHSREEAEVDSAGPYLLAFIEAHLDVLRDRE